MTSKFKKLTGKNLEGEKVSCWLTAELTNDIQILVRTHPRQLREK